MYQAVFPDMPLAARINGKLAAFAIWGGQAITKTGRVGRSLPDRWLIYELKPLPSTLMSLGVEERGPMVRNWAVSENRLVRLVSCYFEYVSVCVWCGNAHRLRSTICESCAWGCFAHTCPSSGLLWIARWSLLSGASKARDNRACEDPRQLCRFSPSYMIQRYID
jgi:hypothetical protein